MFFNNKYQLTLSFCKVRFKINILEDTTEACSARVQLVALFSKGDTFCDETTSTFENISQINVKDELEKCCKAEMREWFRVTKRDWKREIQLKGKPMIFQQLMNWLLENCQMSPIRLDKQPSKRHYCFQTQVTRAMMQADGSTKDELRFRSKTVLYLTKETPITKGYVYRVPPPEVKEPFDMFWDFTEKVWNTWNDLKPRTDPETGEPIRYTRGPNKGKIKKLSYRNWLQARNEMIAQGFQIDWDYDEEEGGDNEQQERYTEAASQVAEGLDFDGEGDDDEMDDDGGSFDGMQVD